MWSNELTYTHPRQKKAARLNSLIASASYQNEHFQEEAMQPAEDQAASLQHDASDGNYSSDESPDQREGSLQQAASEAFATSQLTATNPFQLDVQSLLLLKDVLPVFSGDYKKFAEWLQMYDLLTSGSRNNAEKFLFLKNYLSGRAATMVARFDVTADQYPLAIEALKTKFGQVVDRRAAHIEVFDKICNDFAAGKIDRLSKLVTKISQHISALISLGDPWSTTSDHFMVKLHGASEADDSHVVERKTF